MINGAQILLLTLVSFAIPVICNDCSNLWDVKSFSRRSPAGQCPIEWFGLFKRKVFRNLPIITAGFCENNGTGNCRLLAGRFEFKFNSFKDEIDGPVNPSDYVDSYGYHARVPVSYNTDGRVVYADRSINWAKNFVADNKTLSLLDQSSFNWCAYTENDLWPYKSSIIDYKSKGRYHIYFYNRQSCIFDTKTKSRQFYNTRFLHKSNLRIDLDVNPTIFSMEDNLASGNKIRLIKHHRQHWYEVEFEVKENVNGIRYFVQMETDENLPCKVNSTSGPLMTKKAYERFTDVCISDEVQKARGSTKNAELVEGWCGLEYVETADMVYILKALDKKGLYEVSLHGLMRWPFAATNFYGLDVDSDADWKRFAKDGYTFSATTTGPTDATRFRRNVTSYQDKPTRVKVWSLYSSYSGQPSSREDENYPSHALAIYDAEYLGRGQWDISERDSNTEILPNLNYVDDIAYLSKCKTIIIVYGPLYSEVPADKFGIKTKGPVSSIDNLGAFEMINALFAVYDTSQLFLYHRVNYVSEHQYTCGKPLVTARRVTRYYPRHGPNAHPFFESYQARNPFSDHSEEKFFKLLNVYKGDLGNPEAPDPANYPLQAGPIPEPVLTSSMSWVYILVGVGLFLILAMCLIILLTYRRRRARAKRFGRKTLRSSIGSGAGPASQSGVKTQRSGLKSGSLSKSHRGSRATNRSALGTVRLPSASSSHSHSGPKTNTSTLATRTPSSAHSGASSRPSASTRRATVFQPSTSTRRSLTPTSGTHQSGVSSKPASGRHSSSARSNK